MENEVTPSQTAAPTSNAPKKSNACLIIAAIVIIILALLAVGGFLLYKSDASFIKKAVSTATLNPSCKFNDPDLCKFINNWKTVKYYTINSASTFEGKEQKSIMKSVGDDRFQMTNITGGTENFNMISISDTTYTKDYTDNKWVKTTYTKDKENSTVSEIKDTVDFDSVEDQTEYKKIGEEACGKLACYKYQVIDPEMASLSSKEYILFDNKEYMLRKTISEGPDENLAISEFDYSKITIEVPSPVKEETATPELQAPNPSAEANSSVNSPDPSTDQGASEDLDYQTVPETADEAQAPSIPSDPIEAPIE